MKSLFIEILIEFVHWFQENHRFQIKNNYDDLCKQVMGKCYCIHDLFIVINLSSFFVGFDRREIFSESSLKYKVTNFYCKQHLNRIYWFHFKDNKP